VDGAEERGAHGAPGEDGGGPFRGWIPPDDRLWRHPSERGTTAPAAPFPAPGPAGRGHRPTPWLVGGATVCVALGLTAAGVAVHATRHTARHAVTAVRRTAAAVVPVVSAQRRVAPVGMVAAVGALRPSTVAVLVGPLRRPASVTGVVVTAGGMVVVPTSALGGVGDLAVQEPDGAVVPATAVAADPGSDLTLLRIADDLPAAAFDTTDPDPGADVANLAERPGTGSTRPVVTDGVVLTSGTVLATEGTAPVAATSVLADVRRPDLGSPLVSARGQVLGVLDRVDRIGGTPTGVYLPASLVLGVAQELEAEGTVTHGWLGATATADAPGGVAVGAVAAGGPAALAGVRPGDVVEAVDGAAVHSAAELDTLLYPETPGCTVDLTIGRGPLTLTASVVLAAA
jgi:S1-C subfamily serine protease